MDNRVVKRVGVAVLKDTEPRKVVGEREDDAWKTVKQSVILANSEAERTTEGGVKRRARVVLSRPKS